MEDVRQKMPYEVYNHINFNVPIGRNGDCFDRYILRIEEMRQSLLIMHFCIFNIPHGWYKDVNSKNAPISRAFLKNDMASLIYHFKAYTLNCIIASAETYTAIEAPKGEFGVFLATRDENKAFRCKIKAPGFLHLQGINIMAVGHLLADVVAVIGTADIVFGEVDR